MIDDNELLQSFPPSLRSRVAVAIDHGMGNAVKEIFEVALRHNLGFTAYENKDKEDAIALVPVETGNRRNQLVRIWMKPDSGRLRVYLQVDVFTKFYNLDEEKVASILGEKGWIYLTNQDVKEFTSRLDNLYEIIDSQEVNQRDFFGLMPNIDIGEQVALITDVSTPPEPEYREGAAYDVIQTEYERNREARDACIKHYKPICNICGISFKETYGEIGSDFIHVHHLRPISSYDGEHNVDPIRDLVPVCPNCHAMLHRKKPPYTPDELKNKMRR